MWNKTQQIIKDYSIGVILYRDNIVIVVNLTVKSIRLITEIVTFFHVLIVLDNLAFERANLAHSAKLAEHRSHHFCWKAPPISISGFFVVHAMSGQRFGRGRKNKRQAFIFNNNSYNSVGLIIKNLFRRSCLSGLFSRSVRPILQPFLSLAWVPHAYSGWNIKTRCQFHSDQWGKML